MFEDAWLEAQSALTCFAEAAPGWDVECRFDAERALVAMMAAAQTTTDVLEVVCLRGVLLRIAARGLR